MEIGCSYNLGLRFDRQPQYDDIAIYFMQSDNAVLEFHLADIEMVTGTDDDNNTVYTGWLHLMPSDTAKFAAGTATVKVYAISGEDRLPCQKPFVFQCKR